MDLLVQLVCLKKICMTFDADLKAKVNSATIDKKLVNKKHAKGKEAVLASKEAIELGKKLEK